MSSYERRCVCCGMVSQGTFCDLCLRALVMPWQHPDLEIVAISWKNLAIQATRWREVRFEP